MRQRVYDNYSSLQDLVRFVNQMARSRNLSEATLRCCKWSEVCQPSDLDDKLKPWPSLLALHAHAATDMKEESIDEEFESANIDGQQHHDTAEEKEETTAQEVKEADKEGDTIATGQGVEKKKDTDKADKKATVKEKSGEDFNFELCLDHAILRCAPKDWTAAALPKDNDHAVRTGFPWCRTSQTQQVYFVWSQHH